MTACRAERAASTGVGNKGGREDAAEREDVGDRNPTFSNGQGHRGWTYEHACWPRCRHTPLVRNCLCVSLSNLQMKQDWVC